MSKAAAKARYQRTALEAASRARVGRPARATLAELVALSWPCPDGDGWAVEAVSVAELADRLLATTRTVQRHISTLEIAGLVSVVRGGGRRASRYVLTVESGATPPSIERRQKRHPRGDRNDTPAATKTSGRGGFDLSTFTNGQDTNTSGGAPRGGGGGDLERGVEAGKGLDGRAAVAFERLARRPAWLKAGTWISGKVARELAELEGTTLEVVDAALAAARERGASLRNPAGFVVDRVREPDWLEIEAERGRRARRAEADRLEAERRAERDAERAEAFAVADGLAKARAAAVAALDPRELEAIVDEWIATEAPAFRAHGLALRTPAERVASVLRFGEIDHKLEGVGA